MNIIKLKNFILFYLLFSTFVYSKSENLIYGKKALSKRDYKTAIEYFNKEIHLFPRECYGYYYLGLTYEKLSEKEKSIEQFQNATKVYCPNDLKEQSFWKVVNYYKFIEDWENLYIYSKAFLKFKPNKEVEKYLKIAENNYNPEQLKLKSLLEEAKLLEENEQYNDAAEKYKEIFEIDKKVIYLIKAGNLYKKFDNKNAINIFKKVLEYDSKNWYANYQIALDNYSKGNLNEAKKHIEISYNNVDKKDQNNFYFIQILYAYIELNLENLDKVNNILLQIDKLVSQNKENPKIQKEKNYYFIYILTQILQNKQIENNELLNKFLNPSFEYLLLQWIVYIKNKNYSDLYMNFIKNYPILFDNDKVLAFSNYINQILLILLLENKEHKEKLIELFKLKDNKLFIETISLPYGNILISDYLSNFNFNESSNLLEKEFSDILKGLSFKEYLNLLLIYNTYQIKEWDFLELILNKKEEQLIELNQEKLNAFLFYIKSLMLLKKEEVERSYELIKKAIELNSNYKTIAKKEELIQNIIQKNEDWKNLIESKTLIDFLSN
jgi:hypothetical protein